MCRGVTLKVNIWLGRAGLATHTHFDSTWNYFAQVYGRKRITLLPPTAAVTTYPCLHPNYAHLYEPLPVCVCAL